MDFFKPGSTLKREDPKARSYEHNRARDAYKKQLEIFKIRFEHELANQPKLDFDAKQEVRIKAKRLREKCLSTYRESLQGLATTNHRRNYKDLFLGSRDAAIEMHDTTILDYELRLAHEMDTIITNLGLMKEDKSNRETLDWMASLARQKFSYELFEMNEHPTEVDITLEVEPQMEEEAIYPYEDDMAGPICASRISPPRFKSSFMRELMNGEPSRRSRSRPLEEQEEDQLKDETFNREYNLISQEPRLVRNEYYEPADEEAEMWRIRGPSPARSYFSDYSSMYDRDRDIRSVSRQPESLLSYRREPAGATSSKAPGGGRGGGGGGSRREAPVDVDNDEDVEEFLAKSRALIRRTNKPVHIDYADDEDE